MKAKLIFNLPDEELEFNAAINGNVYRSVIWRIDQYLRSQLKHEEMTDEVSAKVLQIRDELHTIIEDCSISMDQIWQ